MQEQTGFSKEETMFILAAHECTHRVQVKHRGEEFVPSEQLTDEEYSHAANEREAWEEALHAFKKEYPKATGSIICNGVEYTIPKVSKYEVHKPERNRGQSERGLNKNNTETHH